MGKNTTSLKLGVEYNPDTDDEYTYRIHTGTASSGRPARRAKLAAREDNGVYLNGIPLGNVYEFMVKNVPSLNAAIRNASRNNPNHRLFVGQATIETESGEIISAHLYSEPRIGPERKVSGITKVEDES